MTLSERLREETHEAHVKVEKLIIPRIKSLNGHSSYSRLLAIFYGYFKPVEEKIEQHIDKFVVPDIEERRKAAAILEDISFIGGESTTTVCQNLPVIESVPEALGAM